MIALLERELAGGAPIHCLGIQSHLNAVDQPGDPPELRAFLREVDRLGLSVMITLHSHQPQRDGSPLRPLPRNRVLRRKPAWHAIGAALRSRST